MKYYLTILLNIYACICFAQQETYDILSFTAPKGWKKNTLENTISYSTTDNKKRTWAQVGIIKSTASKGTAQADFNSEWKELVVKPYAAADQPIAIDTQSFKGWQLITGLGKFVFNKDTASVLLNTFSNGERCVSFLIMSNTTSYGATLDAFVASINILPQNNANNMNTNDKTAANTVTGNNKPGRIDGFQFHTSNFDDGWTSVVKEDWVEATKGNIKVLLHYPKAEENHYYPQYKERVTVFWNLLIAPRYSNLREYQSPDHLLSWEPGYFAAGLLTEKATGKDVWVAMFNKGKSGWIEVVCPDKKTFVDNFGVDQPHTYFDEWSHLLRLSSMNRFAVGENDLTGKWSNDFSSSTSYYSVYTGLYTGSTTYASGVNFLFGANKTYHWELVMAQGATGTNMKVDQAKANGNWKLLNNWQIWFSEIERKPKTYNAYFSCIKGGRILWLQDTGYGDYTAFGKVEK